MPHTNTDTNTKLKTHTHTNNKQIERKWYIEQFTGMHT